MSSLISYKPVFRDYFYQALQEFMEDNVQYVEVRTVLPDKVCRGLQTCDIMSQLEVAQLYKSVADQFTSDNKEDFCGARMVYAPIRAVNVSTVEQYLDFTNTLLSPNQPPKTDLSNFFVGFDLVGQEDPGKPLIDFADAILRAASGNPNLRFYFHAGETDWSGSSTDMNILDALLLGTRRIGHGYAILKHPETKRLIKQMNVPLEVCPISNQVLGLVSDLRNHPVASLISEGFPIVIASDDPAAWGIKGLSYDYYETFMGLAGRSMDLRFLKKLVQNSMDFSALPDGMKSQCSQLVRGKWRDFIIKKRLQLERLLSDVPSVEQVIN